MQLPSDMASVSKFSNSKGLYSRRVHVVFSIIGLSVLLSLFQNCSPQHLESDQTKSFGSRETNQSWIDGLGREGFLSKPAPLPATAVLLTAREFEGAINKTLDNEDSSIPMSIAFSNSFNGYESGSNLSMNSSALDQLYQYARSRAQRYVSNHIEQVYPCLAQRPETEACQVAVVEGLAKKAYRGRFHPEMIEGLLATYREMRPEGAQIARTTLLTRLFMSPYFLYRIEGGSIESGEQIMSDLEIAEFLSFSIASEPPSSSILDRAIAGDLNREFTERWIAELLQSKRGRENIIRFFKAWLQVEDLDNMSRQPELFSKLESSNQGAALRQEFEITVEDLVFNGAPFEKIFNSTDGFVNRHTASLYGTNSQSEQFQKVELNQNERRGLLSLASFLAVHSAEADPSLDRPIPRGLVVKERILCGQVGLPSGLDINEAAANAVDVDHDFSQMTVRERLTKIMEQEPSCVACHAQFMPYGFLMSNYGGLGQWQFVQNNRPIQSSVDTVFVGNRQMSFSNFVEFAEVLAKSREAQNCFVEQYLNSILGRGLGESKSHLVGVGGVRLRATDGSLLDFIRNYMTTSALFLRSKGEI